MIRFKKAFLIEINYSKRINITHKFDYPSSRYRSSPVSSIFPIYTQWTSSQTMKNGYDEVSLESGP